ncbi:MAG TPA: S41 family peptidase [Prolixibacteraceae bacterium]|nr:S41 family peptidase [Prolixibacteraceae bacterium]
MVTNCFAQTYWRVENERGEEILLTIYINTGDQTFITYTRKDALKEMAGTLMYAVAKAAGKIKYPELMHGEGKITYHADTIFYNGHIDYPDKIFSLKAKSLGDNFYGLLTDSKNKTSILTGEKISSDKPLRDYPALINTTFLMTENYFWDADLKKSSEWQSFKSNVNELKFKIADDYELAMNMMWLGKKLTQVPHEIKKVNKKATGPQQNKNNPLRVINAKKAILNLSDFPDNREESARIFKEILDKKIETLILDASGNKNLPLKSALLLASHLTFKPSFWGCYLTRKWTETEKTLPKPINYEKLLKNPLEYSVTGNEIFNEYGFYLKTVAASPVYTGKVYMVINKGSSNVAEALAIFLKNEKTATLAGQKSAGSPTLTNIFELDKKYRITIPFAQFYDKNGKSHQGAGLEPDLIIEQDPLGYLIRL